MCHVTRSSGSPKATEPNKSAFGYVKTQKFKMTKFHMLTCHDLVSRKLQLNVCSAVGSMHYIY